MNEITISAIIGSLAALGILIFGYPKYKSRGFVRAKTSGEKARAPEEAKARSQYKNYLPFILFAALALPKLLEDSLKNIILSGTVSFTLVLIGGIFLLDFYIRKNLKTK